LGAALNALLPRHESPRFGVETEFHGFCPRGTLQSSL
jgi:hypothetical protein